MSVWIAVIGAGLGTYALRASMLMLLAGRALAVTHAPVPGFARRAAMLRPAVLHPWPWLSRPAGGSVQSFSAWRKAQRV